MTESKMPERIKLQRWGLNWKGHDNAVVEPMDDGYWTPWHIAQEALDRAGTVPEWQPIETAPKDGTHILTYNGNGGGYNSIGCGDEKGDVAVSCFSGPDSVYPNKWMLPHCCDGVSFSVPTHWMPLPQPPKEEV